MEARKIKEAEELVHQAEKALKTGFLKWRPDYDSAASDYAKAATCYKAAKCMTEAKDCLLKAGEYYVKNNSRFSAGKNFEQAAMIYKDMGDFNSCITLIEKAVQLFREHGSPDTAAVCLEKCAKVLEQKYPDKAIEFYQKAADVVMIEDRPRQAAEYAGKATKILLKLKRYDDAAAMLKKEINWQIAGEGAQVVGRLVVAIVLVHLARDDYVAANKIYREYQSYVEKEEMITLNQILEGYDQGDAEQMAQALNHPFIKFMDNEYAKLARTLQAHCSGNVIDQSAVLAAKREAAAAEGRDGDTEDMEKKDEDDEYSGGLL